jgi:cytochrome P450
MTEQPVRFPIQKAPECPFDPHPNLRALDERGTRVTLWDGSTPWLITGYELSRRLLVDPRVSADSTIPGYPHFDLGSRERRKDGRSFVAMDDPEHARLRRMVSAPFTIKNVEALRGEITTIVNDLIDDLLAGPKPADLVSRLAFPTSTQVICRVLGVPYADHDFFQEQSTLMLHRDSSAEMVVAAQDELRKYLLALIDEKIENPEDDLLSTVTKMHVKRGALSREQLSYMAVTLLVAGLETTGNMIALGTLALLEHPDQLELLRNTTDRALITRAVDELIRFLNISHSGRRRVALADVEIGDRTIRAGEGLIMASDVANRDGQIFPDPDTLDIRRDASHHLAFGFGPHHCLGRPLASLELQVVYGTLYRRIPTLELAVELDKVPFKHDGVAYGVRELPVTW